MILGETRTMEDLPQSNKVKIVINGNEKEISEDDNSKIFEIFNKYPAESLILKTIGEINKDKSIFLIPSYQRGYRWGRDEIEALLNDIWELSEKGDKKLKYCLQPLIVKRIVNVVSSSILSSDGITEKVGSKLANAYEILDGQQRLTTIWLIISYLNIENLNYQIYYELYRKIDDDFVRNSHEIIKGWFNKHSEIDKRKFLDVMLNKLTFLYYELIEENDSEKIFRKINKGKIELTNAELFKAMLLNEENKSTANLEQISFEWDKIEHSLANDDFWYFLSSDKEKNRIDFILEVYSRCLNQGYIQNFDITKDRFSFFAIDNYLKNNKDITIINVWENIAAIHDKLYSWYQDNELYHNIGFLVANEGKKRNAADVIINLYKETKDRGIKEVKEIVKSKIYDVLIPKNNDLDNLDDINYTDNKNLIKRILLYSNIYPLLESENKFPFKSYHLNDYDIEHINPQTKETDLKALLKWKIYSENNDETKENEKRNIELIIEYLKSKNKLSDEIEEDIIKTIQNAWDEVDIESDDSIDNLVLLNSKINRSYHNALFNQKRATIIENDKRGNFVPLATKNVFLKYYSPNPKNLILWDESDMEEYQKYLNEMLDEVRKWKK